MRETLFGVPLSVDTTRDLSKPYALLDEVVAALQVQFDDIKSAGLDVTHIKVMGPDEPVRFYVKFPTGKPQYEIRRELERLLFDVGQKLGANELTFYVTKRTKKSKGWAE